MSGGGVSVQRGSLSERPAPLVNRMTHRCKNITLSQTSFASGNDSNFMRIPEIMNDKSLQMSLSFSSMILAQH